MLKLPRLFASRTCLIGLVVLFFFASLYTVTFIGKNSRRSTSPAGGAYVLENAAQVYSLWKRSGARGRVVLHFGRHLHFIPVEGPAPRGVNARLPLSMGRLRGEFESKLAYGNFLWVAMQTNVARCLYNVLPADEFAKKKNELAYESDKSRETSDHELMVYESGLVRFLTDRVPAQNEPVLINVDASYVDAVGAGQFLDELRRSGLRYDMITFCLSKDSPDVTDAQRQKLQAVARLFHAHDGPP